MQSISEDMVWRIAGDVIPPVLEKFEDEVACIAITLKRLPEWYLLGLHSEKDDRLELFKIENEDVARDTYRKRVSRFQQTGILFDD